jgi:hypothetical protein
MIAFLRLGHGLLYLVAAGLYGLEALGSVQKGFLCVGLALVYLGLGFSQQSSHDLSSPPDDSVN